MFLRIYRILIKLKLCDTIKLYITENGIIMVIGSAKLLNEFFPLKNNKHTEYMLLANLGIKLPTLMFIPFVVYLTS